MYISIEGCCQIPVPLVLQGLLVLRDLLGLRNRNNLPTVGQLLNAFCYNLLVGIQSACYDT